VRHYALFTANKQGKIEPSLADWSIRTLAPLRDSASSFANFAFSADVFTAKDAKNSQRTAK